MIVIAATSRRQRGAVYADRSDAPVCRCRPHRARRSGCAGAAPKDARCGCAAVATSHARGDAGLILVEDFHWADPSTIEIVERLASQIGDTRNLLVVTSRGAVIGNVSANILRIVLQRLDDEQRCRDLAGAVVRDKQLPSQLIGQIVARSDGVPLFVEELAAAALETGQVDPGAGTVGASGPSEVPSALYDLLMLRLSGSAMRRRSRSSRR